MKTNSLFRSFDNRSMGFKLTSVFLLVILIPMMLLALISYRVVASLLMSKAEEKIATGLKAAWTEYYTRADQMRYGMLQAATSGEIKKAVARSDRNYLKKVLRDWKEKRPYVDIWTVVDSRSRVIVRLNVPDAGDVFDLSGLVSSAINDRDVKVSTELIPARALKLEGAGVVDMPSGVDDNAKAQKGIKEPKDAIALVVVTPVLMDGRIPLGAIITADVLNNNSHIPELVANKIPGLFTSISMQGVRVATNLMDGKGRSIRNTGIPDWALRDTGAAKSISGEWDVDGVRYLSTFEPIKDFRGKVIGSLDAGISKESLWVIQKKNQRVIALITVIGIAFSLLASFVSTNKITRPLNILKSKLTAFAAGDTAARIHVDPAPDAKDEIKILARAFNYMMDEVKRKGEEKERYLKEIEENNKAFAVLNEELKTKNEEMEVAYEEAQSQTEELHAINEELKLLNEDLDRKNMELHGANKTIRAEEEEIKQAKDKLRLIYDSIQDSVLLIDRDLNIVEANRHFLDSFKTSPDKAVGKRICSFFGLEECVKDCPVKAAIDTGMPTELETTMADGRVFVRHAFPLLDGSEGKAVVYIRDVTHERLLSQRLVHSDKLSSLGELVSGVAHELNNPLTGIMCYSELLMEEGLGEAVNKRLRKVNDATLRCKKIIDNLLTFARWHKPERKYESINNVIRDAVELRSYQLRVDNIEVGLALDETIPKTMLDPHQMEQVFLNLINNGRDAIKEKGSLGSITVKSGLISGMITVMVEDTGAGIAVDAVDKIFDPFFTTKAVGKGTGLGLSISYGIVREHGGDIYASQRPGGGTVFVVELPVISEEKAALEMPVLGAESFVRLKEFAERGLNRVLALDDEEIVLDILEEALKALGFSVDKASTAVDALEKLKKAHYDIIISDIKMPGLSGKEFYREVKKVNPGAAAKIIFISGDSVSADTQGFLADTGCRRLSKPFTIEELNSAILHALSS
ncbi:MAG: response regulator [Deltaproteobacteria bacterium]|nr:response regulator [Deltaproteobacteria bacterium]